jgi:D-beta-D-heptose 7-phosphate kinase/D-beta-D-heptose 1-phosphate adenosyltransferase
VLGVVGVDEAASVLADKLRQRNVVADLVAISGVTTVSKLRVVSRNQQLLRLDVEDGFPGLAGETLLAPLTRCLPQTRVVVLSDYAKGTLSDPQPLIRRCRESGVAVLVDPKGREFQRYRGATLLTPNRAEFEAVMGECADDAELELRGEQLRGELELEGLLVTRSEQGMSLIRRDAAPLHLPAHAREVFDVTGAGDTVIGTLAAGLAAGLDLGAATALANVAAGLVVGKFGTASVTVSELRRALYQHETPRGVVDEEDLVNAVAEARQHGEVIVMTNGCFDILHAGHVAYLEEARRLGTRLVVAVNDDASVGRLKGEGRPVNSLADRMRVLAGLGAVDWVVAFAEDTPARLICRVLPDYLVKGGDYKITEIAGHECVLAAGGQVRSLGFVPGYSTTSTLGKLGNPR